MAGFWPGNAEDCLDSWHLPVLPGQSVGIPRRRGASRWVRCPDSWHLRTEPGYFVGIPPHRQMSEEVRCPVCRQVERDDAKILAMSRDQPSHSLGICVAGGRGGGAPACAASLDGVLRTCGFNVVDMVLARWQNLDMKLPILRSTGAWLARSISR